VTVDLVLQVQVFLQELVPLTLAYGFSLLKFVHESSTLHILLTQVFKQVGKDSTLLFMVVAVGNALHCHLHVLLQVIEIRLLQGQCICQLSRLSLQNEVLAGKVLGFHLVQKSL